jgi:hypothetical protein
MNLDAYDDMMGLEFGDFEQGDEIFSPEMIREALIASTAGGGAVLLTAWGVRMLSDKLALSTKITNPVLRSAVTSGMAFTAGLIGARTMYEYNRDWSMGILGGVGGLALANFLDTLIAQFTNSAKIGVSLGDGDDYGYNSSDSMAALAALEATGVTSAPGAFQGFSDPSVTNEALMGLDGTVVQQETLGEMGSYMPWNA